MDKFVPPPFTGRRKTLRQRSFVYRYPITFQIVTVTLGLSIFFSKPLYDIFIRERTPIDLSEPPVKRDLLKLQQEQEKMLSSEAKN